MNDKLVEKIGDIVYKTLKTNGIRENKAFIADITSKAIASDPSMVEIEVGAKLPKDEYTEVTCCSAYERGQRDMLRAGWVKKKDGD